MGFRSTNRGERENKVLGDGQSEMLVLVTAEVHTCLTGIFRGGKLGIQIGSDLASNGTNRGLFKISFKAKMY